jgi:Ribbon-helix-helix protein, copG family
VTGDPAPGAALTLRIPADLLHALTDAAAAYRVPRSVIVREALTAWQAGTPGALFPPVDHGPAA